MKNLLTKAGQRFYDNKIKVYIANYDKFSKKVPIKQCIKDLENLVKLLNQAENIRKLKDTGEQKKIITKSITESNSIYFNGFLTRQNIQAVADDTQKIIAGLYMIQDILQENCDNKKNGA